jgi:putative acetyltransferase
MKLRKAKQTDVREIFLLNLEAAKTANGVARKVEEILQKDVADFVKKSLRTGLIFVIEHPSNPKKLIAEIHCYKHEPQCFKHVLGNLTLVVHPDFQGQGLGRKIFSHLLTEIKKSRRSIVRVELMTRQNNPRGIKLYQSLGFEIEGVCKNRILDAEKKLGSDVMMAWFNPSFESLQIS